MATICCKEIRKGRETCLGRSLASPGFYRRLTQPSQPHSRKPSPVALGLTLGNPWSSSYLQCCNNIAWCQVEAQGTGTSS